MFAPFMSPEGTAFMTRWWNRMPQYDGLFDFQDRVRPSYFAFKLLSRLTGERLKLESSVPTVHGSRPTTTSTGSTTSCSGTSRRRRGNFELTLEGLPGDKLVRRLTLDAQGPSDDENVRLRPERRTRLAKGDHRLEVELGPYEVKFWSFE